MTGGPPDARVWTRLRDHADEARQQDITRDDIPAAAAALIPPLPDFTAMPGRYTVHATSTQPTKLITREIASAIPIIGTVETLGEALALIKTAYETGAAYACQIDTRPEEPTPPDAAELERLAAITPKMTRNMEP